MRSTRLLRAALATAILGTALSPLGADAGARCPDERKRTRADGWVAMRRAAFSAGGQQVRDWAASAFVDGFVLATNGGGIARTLDAGCSWEEVWSPGIVVGENKLSADATVHGIALSPSIGRLGHAAYAVVGETAVSRVVTSIDLGETWIEQPSAGLPALKRVRSVHVSADPRIAYVVADPIPDPLDIGLGPAPDVETGVYVTRDGGATFAPVNRGFVPNQYTEITVDPADPRQVWAWDQSALYRSQDSGATFEEVTEAKGPISTVDVSHYPPHEPARIIAFRSRRMLATRSDDGGATWREVPSGGRVTGSASLYSRDVLATTSEIGVYVEAPGLGLQMRNVSPRNLVLRDLAWSATPLDATLYGSDGENLYLRRFSPQIQEVVPPKLPPIELHAGLVKRRPTTLEPANAVVRLKPGERRTIEYELDLAPVPTPLDIFFATDSTGSMSGVIASLRNDLQDIIDDLADSGIDVWFGVGDFKDYPAPHGGSSGDHPYKRFRKVGPIDEELEKAIADIKIGGGNGLDSALTATFQAATGEGQRAVDDAGDRAGWWVEPGQGAEWREKAMKVLVIAADVKSRDPQSQPGYPGPSYKTVIDALNLLEIEHVGLAVGGSAAAPYQSLSRVSRGTKTVAPAGGTDCDDDGDVDVEEGMPLVCKLAVSSSGAGNGNGIAPAMISLLKAIEDLQAVSLVVNGPRQALTATSAVQVPAVNVKERNLLKFTVEARCDQGSDGERFGYDIDAKVGAKTVASTGLTVQCASAPGVRRPASRPDFPPPAVRVLVAAAVPPPPPPPQPVPQTNPNPNPQGNPNPNPQPAAQAQAGIAPQEQSRVEVSLAYNELSGDEELAMSGVRHGDAAAAGVLCAGLVLSAGAAVGLRRRTRTATAEVRSSG